MAPLPQASKLKLRCGLEQNKPYNAIKATSVAPLRDINDITLFMFLAILEKHLIGIPHVRYFATTQRPATTLLFELDASLRMRAMLFINSFKARSIDKLKYFHLSRGTNERWIVGCMLVWIRLSACMICRYILIKSVLWVVMRLLLCV